MKVLSLNVRVWTRDIKCGPNNWITRMKKIKWLINYLNPDVLCFQELSFPANLFIPKEYKRVNISFSHPIYVKKEIPIKKHKFRIFFDSVIIYNTIKIVNVHSHWKYKIHYKVIEQINKETNNSTFTVVCGDFNNEKGSNMLYWVKRVPFEKEVDTFINWNRPDESHGIIDHFYTNGFNGTAEVITDYGIMSDHYPILLTASMY